MADARPDDEPNHALVLPNWLFGADADRLVEYAVLAEEHGWDGVFLADHLTFPPVDSEDDRDPAEGQDFLDPWITMAGIATRTETLRLGSWITPVPRRQPWQLARDLASLDRLSGGRVILGAGLGRSTEYTPFGREYEPRTLGERYDEALEVVDGLWRGEPFSYDGDHFTLDDAVVLPTPVQEPRIPVVVGGLWPNRKPFHRGARWDGIVPHFPGDGTLPGEDSVPEEEVRAMLEYYHSLTDDPGEIFLPVDPPDSTGEYVNVCRKLGVTWFYTTPRDEDGDWEISEQLVRAGPP